MERTWKEIVVIGLEGELEDEKLRVPSKLGYPFI